MKSNDHLESFLTTIDNKEIPDYDTLVKVADSLKAMQKGLSFKAAFKMTNKRGRKPVKPISQNGLEEVKPYLDAVQEYYEKINLGQKADDVKAYICKKYGIYERIFDDYRAGYNKVKKFKSGSEIAELFGKIPLWQYTAILYKLDIESSNEISILREKYKAQLPQIRKEYQEILVARNFDPLVQENLANIEAAIINFIEAETESSDRVQKLKAKIPAF
jgi:hypothetical protein